MYIRCKWSPPPPVRPPSFLLFCLYTIERYWRSGRIDHVRTKTTMDQQHCQSFLIHRSQSVIYLLLSFPFRLIIGWVSMSPQVSERQIMTTPSSYLSDTETKNKSIPVRHHRRPQKLCTTQRLPALFAWTLLLGPSFAYWICIFPEIVVLLPKLLPIPILHCALFVLLCANFILATFMDPVKSPREEATSISAVLGNLRAISKEWIFQCQCLHACIKTKKKRSWSRGGWGWRRRYRWTSISTNPFRTW